MRLTDPTSQLILRQLVELPRELLIVNPQDQLPVELQQRGMQVSYWSLHAGHGTANRAVPGLTASTLPEADWPAAVLLILPKEKQLTRFLLAQLAARLPAGTHLWVVGRKNTGIKAFLKRAEPGWSSWQKLASGNHCQLASGQLLARGTFNLADWTQQYPLQLPGGQLTVTGLPGVFSPDRLDPGTQLLLAHLPAALTGEVLDFGCGTGVISAAIQQQFPHAHLTLSDVNPLALTAAKLTLPAPAQARRVLSDGLGQVSGTFDWVITNPPFHAGKDTNYDVSRQLFRALPRLLKPGGQLLLVANRFLPYTEPLNQSFRHCRIVTENNKYRLYHATNATKS